MKEEASAQGLVVCSRTSCQLGPQPPDKFINDSGKVVTTCLQCRIRGQPCLGSVQFRCVQVSIVRVHVFTLW